MTTVGVPYSWEISQPDGNAEGTDISKYSSLGAPVCCLFYLHIIDLERKATSRPNGIRPSYVLGKCDYKVFVHTEAHDKQIPLVTCIDNTNTLLFAIVIAFAVSSGHS